jgi:translation initiation factor 1
MAKKKKRIPIDNADPASLNNAFGSLPVEGLSLAPNVKKASAPATPEKPEKKKGTLILRRETAHRGGKSVVVVYDIPRDHRPETIAALAKKLKQHCGCGGTVKNREIIIQGEKAAEVCGFLQKQGYKVRGVTA